MTDPICPECGWLFDGREAEGDFCSVECKDSAAYCASNGPEGHECPKVLPSGKCYVCSNNRPQGGRGL